MHKGLTNGSAFKFSFISTASAFSSLYLLQILFTFIFGGESSITFNGASPDTLEGLIYSLIALPFLAGIFGGLMAVMMVIGQWIYIKFKPLNLEVVE